MSGGKRTTPEKREWRLKSSTDFANDQMNETDDLKDPYAFAKRQLRSMRQDSSPTKKKNDEAPRKIENIIRENLSDTESDNGSESDESIDPGNEIYESSSSSSSTDQPRRRREPSMPPNFHQPTTSSQPQYSSYTSVRQMIKNPGKGCLLTWKLLFIVVAIHGICLGILYYFELYPFSPVQDQEFARVESIPWSHLRANMKMKLKELEKRFPSESKSTIIGLYSASTSTLTEQNPKQPSCLLLLSRPKANPSFATCFAQNAGMLINQIFEQKFGKGGKPLVLSTSFFDRNMSSVHEGIKDYLDNKGKAIVVFNTQDFKKEEHLLVFHSFCDNLMAHDTRATFLFTATVPEKIYSESNWVWEKGGELSHATLTEAWKNHLSGDKIPAIIARVATTVILLEGNDSCYLP